MIKGVPFIRLGCGWPRDWDRSGSRSNATWTRKKGVRREATEPPGRLYRPWIDPGGERAGDDSRVCEGDRGGGRDAGSRDGDQPGASGAVPRVEGPTREGSRSDPWPYGEPDDRVLWRSVCRWRRRRRDPGQSRARALLSAAEGP